MNDIKNQKSENIAVLQNEDQNNPLIYADVFNRQINEDGSVVLSSAQTLTLHIWNSAKVPIHTHDNYFEIFIVTKGKLIHTFEGKETVLTKGDAFLILPGQYHKLCQYADTQSTHINLTCSLPLAKELFKIYCDTEFPSFSKQYIHLDASFFQIALNFKDIIFKSMDKYYQGVAVKSLFSVILGLFYIPEAELQIPSWLQDFMGELQHLCFDSSFKISDLYKNTNYSRTKISKEFKKYTGQTLVSYINDLKLIHACNQLKSTDFSVMQIATTSGFDTYVHFSRKFKEKYGYTPTEYRKKLRG